jgi:hypothetical protein
MAFNPKLATFSFFIFLFGMIMTYLTIDQQSKLSDLCVSSKVQTSFNIILMLFIMMMIIPLIQLYCHWGCGHPQKDLSYKWIIVIICLILVLLASITLKGIEDEPSCNLSSARSFMIGIITTGVVLSTILVSAPFIPLFKSSLNGFEGSSIEISSKESGSFGDSSEL